MTTINTNTDEVGERILEQYHQGNTGGTFTVSIVDPINDPDPKPEVRDVTLEYED